MVRKIREYLLANGYNGEGLCRYLEQTGRDRRYKAHRLAGGDSVGCDGKTIIRSGIIKYMGVKYYFYCIAPWPYCPEGEVHVEITGR